MSTPESAHIGVALETRSKVGRANRRPRRPAPDHEPNLATRFFMKITSDWIFTLAGALAYNFLLALFPLMLLLLVVAGYALNELSHVAVNTLVADIESALPSGIGIAAVTAANDNLHKNAGILLLIGVVTALFLGSRLFVALDNCFCVIYRVRQRSLVRQNALAFTLTIAFVLGGQLLFLTSSIPTAIVRFLAPNAPSVFYSPLTQVIGSFVGFFIALVVFSLIYSILPNRRIRFFEVWQGAALAAALLVAYLAIFPLYTLLLLRPNAYGAAAGFVILLLFFVYYFSLILLLGAELNAWVGGQRSQDGGISSYVGQQPAQTAVAPANANANPLRFPAK